MVSFLASVRLLIPANWLWQWEVGEVSESSREAERWDISQGSLHSRSPFLEFPLASRAFIFKV